MTVDGKHNDEETAAKGPLRALCLRWREILFAVFILLGIVVAVTGEASAAFFAMLYFFAVPLICLLVRYLWLRLCRDPFLAPSDTFSGICWETITTCPPDLRRTVPTIFYLVTILLTVSALGLSRLSIDAVKLNMFIVIFYNGFGSLLILVCAVWLVDALWLAWLCIGVVGLQGKSGAVQNWWWKSPSAVNSNVDHDDESKSRLLNEDRRLAKIKVAIIFILYIWWTIRATVAAYRPNILELSVPIPRLPSQCDGYRLALAADLHAGVLSGVKDTEWMVEKLNNLNPDAIALVGDIGDTSVNVGLRAKLAPLANLKAPDGSYISFGNHENLHDIEDYRKLLRTEAPFAGKITLLENEHVVLNRNATGTSSNCSIVLVGMADWSGHTSINPGQVAPDFPLALLSTPEKNGTTTKLEATPSSSLPMIVMQHQPTDMIEVAKAGAGLQISGHTHGGQIWPQHILLSSYDAISGLHSFDVGSADGPSYLFVSEGIVGWGPRLRFLCKTDVAVLTLRSPSLMKAEGVIPNTDTTVATFAMYASFVLVPLGVLLCSVPFFYRGYKWFLERRNIPVEKSDNGQDLETLNNEQTVLRNI